MEWSTKAFIALILTLVLGATGISYSGAFLPKTDEATAVSLRNVEARRTHFMRNYALGN